MKKTKAAVIRYHILVRVDSSSPPLDVSSGAPVAGAEDGIAGRRAVA
jgi:hypothetical protein